MVHFGVDSDDREVLAFLHDVADAAADTIDEIGNWQFTGERDGQYSGDVAVDEVVVDMCESAGLVVLSEESTLDAVQWAGTQGRLLVVIDPVDGSTNASRGLPWFATSLCVVDADGPRVGLVAEQSGSETRYGAIRGAGANVDGRRAIVASDCQASAAVVGVNGVPPRDHPWWQVRAMGAAALDICLVGCGALDGWVDFHGHGVWDYLASVLFCEEAGAMVGEVDGNDLFTLDPAIRRRPVVASGPEMMASLLDVVRRTTR